MENRGLCDHCGGELFGEGNDEWWECADCGCTWSLSGDLIRRGPECLAQTRQREAGPSALRWASPHPEQDPPDD